MFDFFLRENDSLFPFPHLGLFWEYQSRKGTCPTFLNFWNPLASLTRTRMWTDNWLKPTSATPDNCSPAHFCPRSTRRPAHTMIDSRAVHDVTSLIEHGQTQWSQQSAMSTVWLLQAISSTKRVQLAILYNSKIDIPFITLLNCTS